MLPRRGRLQPGRRLRRRGPRARRRSRPRAGGARSPRRAREQRRSRLRSIDAALLGLDRIADRDGPGLDDLAPDAEREGLGRRHVAAVLGDRAQRVEVADAAIGVQRRRRHSARRCRAPLRPRLPRAPAARASRPPRAGATPSMPIVMRKRRPSTRRLGRPRLRGRREMLSRRASRRPYRRDPGRRPRRSVRTRRSGLPASSESASAQGPRTTRPVTVRPP